MQITSKWAVIFSFFTALGMTACGHPSLETVFSTSTGEYPVVSDADASALENSLSDNSDLPTTSIVKIQMQAVAEDKMQSVWLQAMSLRSRDGDLGFIQTAKCYLKALGNSSAKPVLIAKSQLGGLSNDRHSLAFEAESSPDLVAILRGPFVILIEIRGSAPASKLNVYADLKLKTRLSL